MSQAAVGAAAALAVSPWGTSRRDAAPWVALLGGLSGMAPDLDVLVRSTSDPLLFLEVHRQFSHALLFIPLGALLCALPSGYALRSRFRFREVYALCLVGFSTHGWLDACTSYGTQLLWPFSDLRVAWNCISVVDPIFTLSILALVALAVTRRAVWLSRAACVFAIAYLLLGIAQRERAEALGREVAAAREHDPISLQAKPSFGNLLVWKTYYEFADRYYIDAVRIGWSTERFPGESTPRLEPAGDLPWLDAGSQQVEDLRRFTRFSSGYVAIDPDHEDRVIDVRYSMLPNRIQALWGLRLNPEAGPREHAEFFNSRRPTKEQRSRMVRMLLGSS